MLVLTAKPGDVIYIDEGKIKVHFLLNKGAQIRLGFEADSSVAIDRERIHKSKERSKLLGGNQ